MNNPLPHRDPGTSGIDPDPIDPPPLDLLLRVATTTRWWAVTEAFRHGYRGHDLHPPRTADHIRSESPMPTPDSDALLPTADQLIAAMGGHGCDTPILAATEAMFPVHQQRFMSFGVLNQSDLPHIDTIRRAADRLVAATDDVIRLAQAIDRYTAESVPLRPSPAATPTAYTIGELASQITYFTVMVWAARTAGKDAGEEARLNIVCDAYDELRTGLLAGHRRLTDRITGSDTGALSEYETARP
jgi:hypothetical protein